MTTSAIIRVDADAWKARAPTMPLYCRRCCCCRGAVWCARAAKPSLVLLLLVPPPRTPPPTAAAAAVVDDDAARTSRLLKATCSMVPLPCFCSCWCLCVYVGRGEDVRMRGRVVIMVMVVQDGEKADNNNPLQLTNVVRRSSSRQAWQKRSWVPLLFCFAFFFFSSLFGLCRPPSIDNMHSWTAHGETHTHTLFTKSFFSPSTSPPPFVYSSSTSFSGKGPKGSPQSLASSRFSSFRLSIPPLYTYVRPPQNSGHSHLST